MNIEDRLKLTLCLLAVYEITKSVGEDVSKSDIDKKSRKIINAKQALIHANISDIAEILEKDLPAGGGEDDK